MFPLPHPVLSSGQLYLQIRRHTLVLSAANVYASSGQFITNMHQKSWAWLLWHAMNTIKGDNCSNIH